MTTPLNLFYREVPLNKGQVAIVDTADYDWLNQWKWFAWWNSHTHSFYARRTVRVEGRNKTVWMNRLILGLELGDKRQGDHKNLNTLDNRRENLRIATHSQNHMNRPAYSNNSSGIKGVSFKKDRRKWSARIQVGGTEISLGYFHAKKAAAQAYALAAEKYHGEFARTA